MNKALEVILKTTSKVGHFPDSPASNKKQAATSALLATFRDVPILVKKVLGCPSLSSENNILAECFTQAYLDEHRDPKIEAQRSRQAEIIVVKSDGKTWSVLIDCKIGGDEHTAKQIEGYLDVAQQFEIDAVVTISNQAVVLPVRHLVDENTPESNNVSYFHLSWFSILAKSHALAERVRTEDAEQAKNIGKFLNYLDSEKSGVTSLARMKNSWNDVTQLILRNTRITKYSNEVIDTVAIWQQLQCIVSIHLSTVFGKSVQQHLTFDQDLTADSIMEKDADKLVSAKPVLSSEFNIPNVAARLNLEADFAGRNLTLSMKLDTPVFQEHATALSNWISMQLKGLTDPGIIVCLHWSKSQTFTQALSIQAKEDPYCLIPEGCKDIPAQLEITRLVDFTGQFTCMNKFAEGVIKEAERFYTQVGHQLSPWVAKPKKRRLGIEELLALDIDCVY